MFSTIPSLIAKSFPGATGGGGFDPDAQTYIDAVLAAGGSLSSPQQDAVNTLYVDLKANSLYSKIYAFWPQLGGVSNSNGLNAKSPGTHNLVWNGGFTYTNTLTTGNGTTGYAYPDSFAINSWITNPLSFHVIGYQNTSNTPTGSDEHMMGSITSNGLLQVSPNNGSYGGNTFYRFGDASFGTFSMPTKQGLHLINKSGSTTADWWKNGSKLYSINSGNSPFDSGSPFYFWALYYQTAPYPTSYANQGYSFLSLGFGLTDGEVTTMSSIINTFQTSLGRNTY